MRRSMLVARLCAALGLTLWLIGAVAFQAAAQGNETGSEQTAAEATPTDGSTDQPTEEPTEAPPATGTLTILAYLCTAGGNAGTGAIYLEGDFSPDKSCTENTASVAIDGGDATDVAGSADFTLDAGTHSLADTTTGAALDVEVVADGVTTISVVAYAAPTVEEELPTPTDEASAAEDVAPADQGTPTTIHLITHDCAPSVQTADFASLDAKDKLTTCPVITRQGDDGPDGAVDGGYAVFDFSFAVDGGETQTLAGNATFAPAHVCESDLGEDVDGDGEQNTCFDDSDYAVTVSGGAVTIAETTVPDKHRFGAVELPDADDAATLDPNSVDVDAGSFVVDPSLDVSGDGELVIDVYNFSPPRVNVVVHNCPDTIKKTADFNALGDFAGKLKGCPAIAAADYAGLGITVAPGNPDPQTLADATLVDALVCESDLQADLDDGDPADFCLAGYAFDDVSQGNVTVTETPPAGRKLGWAIADPVSVTSDPAPFKAGVKSGVASLSSAEYGEVTVHLFNLVSSTGNNQGGNQTSGNTTSGGNDTGGNNTGGNDTGGDQSGGDNGTGGNNTGGNDTGGGNTGSTSGGNTGGNTGDGSQVGSTSGGGTGSLAIYTLYCLTSSEYTDIEVFNPGQEVNPNSLGDDTCIEDGNEYQITEFSRDDQPPFEVDYTGFAQIDGLPTTDGKNPHLITETWSGETQPFEIATGQITEVVVLVWEYDDSYDSLYQDIPDDSSGGVPDDSSGDVADVQDGEDLPDTGVGPISPPDDGMVLLLGLAGFLVLGAASRLRRSPHR
jgi:hypothetical protein